MLVCAAVVDLARVPRRVLGTTGTPPLPPPPSPSSASLSTYQPMEATLWRQQRRPHDCGCAVRCGGRPLTDPHRQAGLNHRLSLLELHSSPGMLCSVSPVVRRCVLFAYAYGEQMEPCRPRSIHRLRSRAMRLRRPSRARKRPLPMAVPASEMHSRRAQLRAALESSSVRLLAMDFDQTYIKCACPDVSPPPQRTTLLKTTRNLKVSQGCVLCVKILLAPAGGSALAQGKYSRELGSASRTF